MKSQVAKLNELDRMCFVFRGGRLSLDLVATLGSRGHWNFERLQAPPDLDRWLIEAGLARCPADATKGDLEAAIALREAVNVAVRARSSRRAAVCAINRLAAEAPLTPVLCERGREMRWLEEASVTRALSIVARDAIALLASPQLLRVRECANPECTVLFLDSSRPGRRRWCSMEDCGNQAKSAGLRAKRLADRVLT